MTPRAILIAGAVLIGGVLLYDAMQAMKQSQISPDAGPGTITSPSSIQTQIAAAIGTPQQYLNSGVSGSF